VLLPLPVEDWLGDADGLGDCVSLRDRLWVGDCDCVSLGEVDWLLDKDADGVEDALGDADCVVDCDGVGEPDLD
jgi:hypothetical protein